MKKRIKRKLRKKLMKDWMESAGFDPQACMECGKRLDVLNDYHWRYNTCNAKCYADMVGVNLYEF